MLLRKKNKNVRKQEPYCPINAKKGYIEFRSLFVIMNVILSGNPS